MAAQCYLHERKKNPFILLLVGIPGAGKSHFAAGLEQKSCKFVRISQDVLGNRNTCENLARKVLAEGKIAVIDRCNFDEKQRRIWTNIATENGVPCDCIVFMYNKNDCIMRCMMRKNHETIRADEAARVVSTMDRNFRPPIPLRNLKHSGFAQCSGERFRRLEFVTSFNQSDALADNYLRQNS